KTVLNRIKSFIEKRTIYKANIDNLRKYPEEKGVYKVFIEDYISQSHMFTHANERYIRERAFHATCIGESPEIVYIAGGAKNEELTKYNHKTKALISIKTENSIILKRNFFTMSFIRDHK